MTARYAGPAAACSAFALYCILIGMSPVAPAPSAGAAPANLCVLASALPPSTALMSATLSDSVLATSSSGFRSPASTSFVCPILAYFFDFLGGVFFTATLCTTALVITGVLLCVSRLIAAHVLFKRHRRNSSEGASDMLRASRSRPQGPR